QPDESESSPALPLFENRDRSRSWLYYGLHLRGACAARDRSPKGYRIDKQGDCEQSDGLAAISTPRLHLLANGQLRQGCGILRTRFAYRGRAVLYEDNGCRDDHAGRQPPDRPPTV